jgi:hypothetical protein
VLLYVCTYPGAVIEYRGGVRGFFCPLFLKKTSWLKVTLVTLNLVNSVLMVSKLGEKTRKTVKPRGFLRCLPLPFCLEDPLLEFGNFTFFRLSPIIYGVAVRTAGSIAPVLSPTSLTGSPCMTAFTAFFLVVGTMKGTVMKILLENLRKGVV